MHSYHFSAWGTHSTIVLPSHDWWKQFYNCASYQFITPQVQIQHSLASSLKMDLGPLNVSLDSWQDVKLFSREGAGETLQGEEFSILVLLCWLDSFSNAWLLQCKWLIWHLSCIMHEASLSGQILKLDQLF